MVIITHMFSSSSVITSLAMLSGFPSAASRGSFIAQLTCMSMRLTCPFDAKSELRMGLVTVLFRDFLDFEVGILGTSQQTSELFS